MNWANRVGSSKDRGTRESQARRLPHPVTQPHLPISVINLLGTEGFLHARH